MKKIVSLILAVLMLVLMSACGGEIPKDDGTSKIIANVPEKPQFVNVGENGSRTADALGFQLEKPALGEKIVVFETTMGNIYMRLFPNSAPITVTNFVGLVENGYYNGISFHRVIDGFMIQGGDPEGTGMGGNSVWGTAFEDEFNANLLNIRGSVSMANTSSPNTNTSQFFINQNKTSHTKETLDYNTLYGAYYSNYKDTLENNYKYCEQQYGATFKDMYPTVEGFIKAEIDNAIAKNAILSNKVPNEVWELYKTHGGNITLDGAWKAGTGHTVFAQVFKGMDIVDSIAAVETDENDKPLTAVIINKAYTTTVTEDMLG